MHTRTRDVCVIIKIFEQSRFIALSENENSSENKEAGNIWNIHEEVAAKH